MRDASCVTQAQGSLQPARTAHPVRSGRFPRYAYVQERDIKGLCHYPGSPKTSVPPISVDYLPPKPRRRLSGPPEWRAVPGAQGACVARAAGPRGEVAGRLPGAPAAQAQDQEQQGRGQGQARGAEERLQPGLQREAAHARRHVLRRPVRAAAAGELLTLSERRGGDFAARAVAGLRPLGPARAAACLPACLPSALPGMSRRGPRSLGPEVPDSPPPRNPHPRAPPCSQTVSWKTGREEEPSGGRGWDFP